MNTENFYKEVYFTSAKELFQELSPFGKYSDVLSSSVFRGESSKKYQLIPSALRKINQKKLYDLSGYGQPDEYTSETEHWQQQAEFYALKKFYFLVDQNGITIPEVQILRENFLSIFHFFRENQLSKTWIADELLELAALAQHYGIPTRLLDWSFSHMVSLYFAVSGVLKSIHLDGNDEMVLWALNYQEIEFLKESTTRIPIKFLKPTYHRNPNLFAQKGILTAWEYKNCLQSVPTHFNQEIVNRDSLDKLILNNIFEQGINLQRSDSSYPVLIYKFHLPVSEAENLYRALVQYNYGADTIFSGFKGITQRMEDDASIVR